MNTMRYFKFCLIICLLFLFVQYGFGVKSIDGFSRNSSNTYCKENKEIAILLNVAEKLIEKNKYYINKVSEHKKNRNVNKRPLYLNIEEGNMFNGAASYSIVFSDANFNSSHLPTTLFESQGLYIVMYLRSQESILKKNIPNFFFKKSEDYLINDESWTALICKESGKTLVVEDSFLSYKEIKQIQDFSCNGKDSDDIQIKIEDPIIIPK